MSGTAGPYEQLPGGSKASVCDGYPLSASSPPFGAARQSGLWCWSRVNGMFGEGDWEGLTAKHPGFALLWSFPMLVAAVDPVAEAKLDGLNQALTSGHYLTEHEGLEFEGAAGGESTFPVLAADTSGLGEYASVQVQRLPSPESPPVLDPAAMGKDATAPGQTVERAAHRGATALCRRTAAGDGGAG